MSKLIDAAIERLIDNCKEYYRDFKPIDADEIRDFALEKNLDVEGLKGIWKGLKQVYEHKTMPGIYYFHKAYDLIFPSNGRKRNGPSKYDGIIRDNNALYKKWETLDSKAVYQKLEEIYSKKQTEWDSTDLDFIQRYSDVYFEARWLMESKMDKEGVKEHADYILNAINKGELYRTRRGLRREATPEQLEKISKEFKNLNIKNPS